MTPFAVVSGIAAALPAANVDTDVIMPKQFLKGIDRQGLDLGVFHDLRFDEAGRPRAGFVLNQPPWTETRFLVVGPNFGCGSSREHAVWGLGQLGVRAVIGTSFAGIFADNCARNGLLLITLPPETVEELVARASDPGRSELTIDLAAQRVTTQDGYTAAFDIEPSRKAALLQGLDAVGRTLEHLAEIDALERRLWRRNPWLAVHGAPGG